MPVRVGSRTLPHTPTSRAHCSGDRRREEDSHARGSGVVCHAVPLLPASPGLLRGGPREVVAVDVAEEGAPQVSRRRYNPTMAAAPGMVGTGTAADAVGGFIVAKGVGSHAHGGHTPALRHQSPLRSGLPGIGTSESSDPRHPRTNAPGDMQSGKSPVIAVLARPSVGCRSVGTPRAGAIEARRRSRQHRRSGDARCATWRARCITAGQRGGSRGHNMPARFPRAIRDRAAGQFRYGTVA